MVICCDEERKGKMATSNMNIHSNTCSCNMLLPSLSRDWGVWVCERERERDVATTVATNFFTERRLRKSYLFSGFLTTRLRIMRHEFFWSRWAPGNFCMDWIARSPAPASTARAALSGDLNDRVQIIDITCTAIEK